MKVVQFAEFGVPHEVGACVEVADPEPPAGNDVLVEVEAFPINPADLLTLEGRYASRPPLPAIPGAEGAGRVVATGPDARSLNEGDRVLMLGRSNWVQRCKAPEEQLVKLPPDVDVRQAAMLKVNPATAYMMLHDYVSLSAGEWLIQDAANSGVGTAMIALAGAEGIKTVNVVRRPELVGPLGAEGADVVVVDGPDLAARVAEATNGADIRLGIDAVAGEGCLRLSQCLARGATLVNYGMLSNAPCMVSPYDVVFKEITLTGFWLATALPKLSRDEIGALYGRLAEYVRSGTLNVAVEATYGIDEIKAALAHAERAGRSGKVIVAPNGEL